MKDNKLTIQINKPVAEIFAFTIDPKNTPLWIDGVVRENTSNWPVKAGTVYKNQNKEGEWSIFTMVEFVKNDHFVLIGGDKNYHCRYSFRDLGNGSTEFEYREWVDSGELDGPFTQDILEKLKTTLENLQPLP